MWIKFEREPGYFLGSIYFNYGVTAFFVTIAAVVTVMFTEVSERTLLISLGTFCVLFPMWFFRLCAALWMAWDHFADPLPAPTGSSSTRTPSAAEQPQRSNTPG